MGDGANGTNRHRVTRKTISEAIITLKTVLGPLDSFRRRLDVGRAAVNVSPPPRSFPVVILLELLRQMGLLVVECVVGTIVKE